MRRLLLSAWPEKVSVRIFLVLTALLVIHASAKAAIIAYEGFDYPAGTTITNQNGGLGWGSAWSAISISVPATNRPGSLTYANGNAMMVTGNHLLVGYADGNDPAWPAVGGNTVAAQRQLVNTQSLGAVVGGAGGTIWLSFLCQNYNTEIGEGHTGFRETKLLLLSGATTNTNGIANVAGSERLNIGVPNTYVTGASDTYSLYAGGNYVSSGVTTVRGAQYLGTAATMLLVRIDLDGTTANDTASLWVNPVLGPNESTLGTAQAVYTDVNLDWINGFRFQAGNANLYGTNSTWSVDEFRIGTDFNDISPVPEPSVTVLLGVALSGLWRSIRRRK